MSKQTFFQFLFSSTGHGKWRWPETIVLYAFMIWALKTGIEDAVWYVVVPFYAIVQSVIIWAHWQNYKGRQA
jgi:hypothetical protein